MVGQGQGQAFGTLQEQAVDAKGCERFAAMLLHPHFLPLAGKWVLPPSILPADTSRMAAAGQQQDAAPTTTLAEPHPRATTTVPPSLASAGRKAAARAA